MKVKFIVEAKVYKFNNVTKLHIDGNNTIIGYTDNEDVYHEESGNTPELIILSQSED